MLACRLILINANFHLPLIFVAVVVWGRLAIRSQSSPQSGIQKYHFGDIMDLHIKLRDGFSDDTVSISVDNKQVYRKSGISTDLTISFADAVIVQVGETDVDLAVSVDGGQSACKRVRVDQTPFVEVWLLDGKMELRESKEETPML